MISRNIGIISWQNETINFNVPNSLDNKSIYRDDKWIKSKKKWFLIVVIISRYIDIISEQN